MTTTTTTTTTANSTTFSSIEPDFNIHSLYGCNLILPAVSIGNVGQLAIDLLIQTLGLKRVGHLDDEDVVPIIGRTEDGSSLSTPLEVYHSAELKLVVIQQRSPVLRDARARFADRILSFSTMCQISQVILLASIDGAYRLDSQLGDSVYRALTTSDSSILTSVKPLEADTREREDVTEHPEQGISLPPLRHGGITRQLISLAMQRKITNVSALISFAIEGDNVPDALRMADYLDGVLHLRKNPSSSHWESPQSWQGLFGNSLEQTLYQ